MKHRKCRGSITLHVYVVIPTFNEAENLSKLVERILERHPMFRIIVVDDNSPDGTGGIADALSREDSRISVIHRPRKAGLGTAYVEGIVKALENGADLVFEMDADFSHDPEYLNDFLVASEDADLVIGSRYIKGGGVKGWRFHRLLVSKLANIYVSRIMVRPVRDFTAGYRCYRRRALESIGIENIKSDGYAFQIEMTYLAFKNAFKVVEIPIIFKERNGGVSKLSGNVVWEAFWKTLKWHAPVHAMTKFFFRGFGDYLFPDE